MRGHDMCPCRMFKMMITPKMHHYLETRMLLLWLVVSQILGVSNFCVLGHPDNDPSS